MKDFSDFRQSLDEIAVPAGSLPPNILILRRKSVRAFPDSMVALYYNDKLDQYFSVPFGGTVDSAITAASMKEELHPPTKAFWEKPENRAMKAHLDAEKKRADAEAERHRKEQSAKYHSHHKEIVAVQDQKAQEELNEESEQLDELQTPTLDSYLSKRVQQIRGGTERPPFKTYKGVSRAISKLNLRTGNPDSKKAQAAKDALNRDPLDEQLFTEDAISHLQKVVKFETNTPLNHRDGKQTKVDPTTAKALLTVHGALSKENQSKFADHLEKSKDHFHRMLDFTWKQVK